MSELLFSLKPNDFLRGISAGRYLNTGLFDTMLGIDILKTKNQYGLLGQGYPQTQIGSEQVADTIKYFVKRGSLIYAFGDDGYLYSISPTTDTVTVLDSGNEATRGGANGGGYGLVVYQGVLHYFWKTGCGTSNFSTFTNGSYTTNITDNPHPALAWQDILYFGNGAYIGTITDTTLNAQAFPLPVGDEVQDILIHNNYLVILTIQGGSTNGTISKLYFWDTINTDGWNFEYELPEKCYALEKYKNDFMIFGDNARLFNGGNFSVIREFSNNVIRPGQTAYKNNSTYFLRYSTSTYLEYYGSPSEFISPAIHSPLFLSSAQGSAIFSLDSETNEFLMASADNKLFHYKNTGYSGGSCRTRRIPMNRAKIQKIGISFEPLTADDGVKIYLNDDTTQTLMATINYSVVGAKAYKELSFHSKPLNYASLTIDWSDFSSGDLKIREIALYGEQTELPT